MTRLDFEGSADVLKALAHPVRLAILNTLAESERSVGDIETAAGIGQPALSQQLAVLRNAGLVVTRREAKLVFYRINRSQFAGISALLDGMAGGDEERTGTSVTRPHDSRGAAAFARIVQQEH